MKKFTTKRKVPSYKSTLVPLSCLIDASMVGTKDNKCAFAKVHVRGYKAPLLALIDNLRDSLKGESYEELLDFDLISKVHTSVEIRERRASK